MFLGHYGVALAAKCLSRGTSLGTFAFAAEWCDELWPILLLLGVEQVRVVPGLMAASPLDFVRYPISHSLLAVVGWAAVIGFAYFLARRNVRAALIVGAAVLSHWLLDLPMHRPDLQLWPGGATKVGLGLWNSLPASVAIELLCLAAGAWLYVRSTRARDRIGAWGLWSLIALLCVIYFGSLLGPPPASERAVALSTLGLWLFVPWAAWVDRHRTWNAVTPAA